MPFVEIETPHKDPVPDGYAPDAIHGWGTVVKVDGREVQDVRSLRLDVAVDSAITVTLECFVTKSFEFKSAADLHIHVGVLPGYRLIEETRADGSRVFRAEEEVTS